jgi:hypothetical protein
VKNPTDVDRFHQALTAPILLVSEDGSVRSNPAWTRRFGTTPERVHLAVEGSTTLDVGAMPST